MREIRAPFIELTTAEAGKLLGISGQAMRRRCEQGLVDCYRTEGGQWRVKLRPEEVMPREEAEALRQENADLRARLDAAVRVLSSAG